MTRWARSGSTQKHKKMPGDATPWKEFARGEKKKSDNSHKNNKMRTDIEGKKPQVSSSKYFSPCKYKKLVNSNISGLAVNRNLNEQEQMEQIKSDIDELKTESDSLKCSLNVSNNNYAQTDTMLSVKKKKAYSSDLRGKNEVIDLSQEKISTKIKPKRANKRKIKSLDSKTEKHVNSSQEEIEYKSAKNRRENMLSIDDKPINFLSRNELSIGGFHEKKIKNGCIPLPLKVEQKLSDLNKQLREKGLSAEEIRNIMRKQKRYEKRKVRKRFSSKLCFNCRQRGHLLAECPVTLGPSDQQTNICFKCGSTNHKSSKCTKEIEGYPLAKCFICDKQGHISKDCPQNNHGIYPDGGKCNLCGNINHLRKDCPSLKKKKEEEILSLHTINEGRSIDDEIMESEPQVKTKVFKKPKIVKFL